MPEETAPAPGGRPQPTPRPHPTPAPRPHLTPEQIEALYQHMIDAYVKATGSQPDDVMKKFFHAIALMHG